MDRINTLLVDLQNRRQAGQGLVEYALILALVSVTAAAALTTMSGDINAVFAAVSGALAGA
jgi:Flp pilus assembly pilin Flp